MSEENPKPPPPPNSNSGGPPPIPPQEPESRPGKISRKALDEQRKRRLENQKQLAANKPASPMAKIVGIFFLLLGVAFLAGMIRFMMDPPDLSRAAPGYAGAYRTGRLVFGTILSLFSFFISFRLLS